MGEAAQVPTQWSGDEAAEAVLVLKQQRQKRRRASGRSVLLRFITILRGIEVTLHLTAVSSGREGCSIVARVADRCAVGR
jgi:hypothetical protein